MLFSIEHNAVGHTITHERAPGVTLWAEKARAGLTFLSYLPADAQDGLCEGPGLTSEPLLILRFHPGIDKPAAPPTQSLCPYTTLG